MPQSDVPSSELETVFVSGDPGLVAVAKSVLQSAGIRFHARGDKFPVGLNVMLGPVELQVAPEQAEDARRLLRDLTSSE